MFTGIVETLGTVVELHPEKSNLRLVIRSDISKDLRIDQSVSHNGVCLTVVAQNESEHQVVAIDETLIKSNLGEIKVGDPVNLERCMLVGSRFDGHIVQGHVDQKAECVSVENKDGSWLYSFKYDPSGNNFTVEKGSICINGTSLTVVDSKSDGFSVAIIPYTYQNTTFYQLKKGQWVNLEFDIIGKYIAKVLERKGSL